MSDQQSIPGQEIAHRLKESEDHCQAILLAHERAKIEKEIADKQLLILQQKINQFEEKYEALRADKHQADLTIAILGQKSAEKLSAVEN